MKPQTTCAEKKLGLLFPMKVQTIFEHKHDLIYHGKRLSERCIDNYIGETASRINEKTCRQYRYTLQSTEVY